MGQGKTWTEAQRAARLDKLVERNRSQNDGEHKYEDADWMRDAYEVRGLSLRALAAEAGCSLRTAARWVEIHGVSTRPKGNPNPSKGEAHYKWKGGVPPCPVCGQVTAKTRSKAKTCQSCRDRDGDRNPRWRGDEIENPQAHGRIRSLRGKASDQMCLDCDGPAAHWAYDHEDPNEKQHKQGPYSLDPWHYIPLCARCHKRFDLAYLAAKREQRI